MKLWISTVWGVFFLGIALFSFTSLPAQAKTGRYVIPKEVFIPSGFDSNDLNPQIVVHGFFSDSCDGISGITVRRRLPKEGEKHGKVLISISGSRQEGVPCLQVRLPFREVINLGSPLPVGVYGIFFLTDNPQGGMARAVYMGELGIHPAPVAKKDNYHYPIVSSVFLRKDPETGKPVLFLEASTPNNCLQFEEITTRPTARNVLEVLPKLRKSDKANCQPVLTPFKVSKILPSIPTETFLIHTRSMESQAFNRVYLKEEIRALMGW